MAPMGRRSAAPRLTTLDSSPTRHGDDFAPFKSEVAEIAARGLILPEWLRAA